MTRHSQQATRDNRIVKPKKRPTDTDRNALNLWRQGDLKSDRTKKLAAYRMWRRLALTWASRRNAAERYGIERGWLPKPDPFARVNYED